MKPSNNERDIAPIGQILSVNKASSTRIGYIQLIVVHRGPMENPKQSKAVVKTVG